MQAQSRNPDQSKKIQSFGMAAFIGAGVLFALGFILMLTADGVLMSHQLPLLLMMAAAIDVCFAAALSAMNMPAVEKTRLRALSILGAAVVVVAATLISANFRVGTFELVIMVLGLGGAWGMYRLGEIVGAKLTAAKTAQAPSDAAAQQSTTAAAPKPSESTEAPKGSESSPTA